MNRFTPILIIILIIGVVSVSGCITVLDTENDTPTEISINNQQNSKIENNNTIVSVNKSGNINIGTVDGSNNIKKNNTNKAHSQSPKISNETSDKPTPIEGIMPKLSHNEAKKILDKELYTNYSIYEASYKISDFVENDTPFYNISIEEFDEDNVDRTYDVGYVIMNANTGEIISVSLEKENNTISNNNKKVYSVDEAGAYIDIVYKGRKVSVRENYPYYSPQNDKIYYSQEEEAEDLIKLYDEMN